MSSPWPRKALRRPLVLLGAGCLLAAPGPGHTAGRIYENAGTWYVVSHGVIVFSQFYADGPDHARTYGQDTDAEGVFARVRQTGPTAVGRFGVQLEPASDPKACTEEKTQNALGADGWAFSCTFKIASTGNAPVKKVAAAPPPLPATSTAAPAKVATAAPKPSPVAPAPSAAAPAASRVATAVQPPGPVAPPKPQSAVPTAAAPAGSASDSGLNAKILQANREVDERNHAAQTKFEADQAAYLAQRKAYDAQVVAQKAEAEALTRKHAADLAAWEARVKACKAGDSSQCAQ